MQFIDTLIGVIFVIAGSGVAATIVGGIVFAYVANKKEAARPVPQVAQPEFRRSREANRKYRTLSPETERPSRPRKRTAALTRTRYEGRTELKRTEQKKFRPNLQLTVLNKRMRRTDKWTRPHYMPA